MYLLNVPKTAHPADDNDFRPITLTSVVMKCFKKCMVSVLRENVNSHLDPLQIVRGTGYAINSLIWF